MGPAGPWQSGLARLDEEAGFTLIEALLVIVVSGILLVLAGSAFQALAEREHDSAAEAYLAVAYRVARQQAIDANGFGVAGMTDTAALVDAINLSTPLDAEASASAPDADALPTTISVVASTEAVTLQNRSQSGHVCLLGGGPNGNVPDADCS